MAEGEAETGPASTGADPSDTAARNAIATDLRTLASIRSRATARTRPLPDLEAQLAPEARTDPEARYAALEELIETAIATVDDQGHRLAAQRLIGRGPGRWRPLKLRGAEAASVFQVGWDAYRRRHDEHGRSALEETLDLVAGAIVAQPDAGPADATGADRPSDQGAGASIPADPVDVTIEEARPETAATSTGRLPSSSPATSRFWVVVAVVAMVAGAISAIVILGVQRSGRPEATGIDCGDLASTVGELRPGSDPVLEAWSDPFRAYADTLDPALVRCATPMETTRGEVFQRVATSGDAATGALVATADGSPEPVVYLSPPEEATFTTRELRTAEGEDRLGKAVERDDRADSTRVVIFESGVIISESDEAPAIAVTKRFWEAWTDRGGLDGLAGRPIGVAYTETGESRRQDFEGGRLEAGFTDGELVWLPTPSDAPPLPSEHLGRVVIASDGETSWFIDRDGARHWLPSAEDVECVEDAQVQASLTDVDVRMIAALPLGTMLRCA